MPIDPRRLSSTDCIRNAQTYPEPGASVPTTSHRPPAEHFGYNPIHCTSDTILFIALRIQSYSLWLSRPALDIDLEPSMGDTGLLAFDPGALDRRKGSVVKRMI